MQVAIRWQRVVGESARSDAAQTLETHAAQAIASDQADDVLDDRIDVHGDTLRVLLAEKGPQPADLRFLAVDHTVNVAAAPEEADRVAREIRAVLGWSCINCRGEASALNQTDFMVVAPYNAQVRLLRRTLETAGFGDVPVGTVDKFQGREAPVVFYSMATSSAEDVPRTLDFLFSRNRLNAAVSRAMCLVHGEQGG